jgi:hypothetical protein
MRALVGSQIDPFTRAGDTGQQGRDELVTIPDEREHGAVVVGIRVNVEQLRMRRHRLLQCTDRVRVASLREVRHRFERQRHRAYSRSGK